MSRLAAKRLIGLRTHRLLGPSAHRLLRYLHGIELPSEVPIGPGLAVHHRAFGLVVHPNTSIGARVHLFHGVTIGVGRDRIWESKPPSELGHIVIEDDVWICAGAMILGGEGELRVGRGTVVGANSVLRDSTGPWEIWAGVPARKIGTREPTIWLPRRDRDPETGASTVPIDDVEW